MLSSPAAYRCYSSCTSIRNRKRIQALLPHDLHLTGAEPVLSASPSLHSCPVFFQPWPRRPSIWSGRRERPGGLGERSLSLLKSFPATSPCLLLGLFVVNHFPCRMKYVSPWSLETYTALKSLRLCPLETSTKEVGSSCSRHMYKGEKGAVWADMAICFTLKHLWMPKGCVINLKSA